VDTNNIVTKKKVVIKDIFFKRLLVSMKKSFWNTL